MNATPHGACSILSTCRTLSGVVLIVCCYQARGPAATSRYCLRAREAMSGLSDIARRAIPGWSKQWSNKLNKPYWSHEPSKKSQWEPPDDDGDRR